MISGGAIRVTIMSQILAHLRYDFFLPMNEGHLNPELSAVDHNLCLVTYTQRVGGVVWAVVLAVTPKSRGNIVCSSSSRTETINKEE